MSLSDPELLDRDLDLAGLPDLLRSEPGLLDPDRLLDPALLPSGLPEPLLAGLPDLLLAGLPDLLLAGLSDLLRDLLRTVPFLAGLLDRARLPDRLRAGLLDPALLPDPLLLAERD